MNKTQEIQLDVLRQVDAIALNHGIRYSLSGGSVLGAVRHLGFIPWDDDIDIHLIREEYERFLSIVKEELNPPYKLMTYKEGSAHHYYFSRVVNTDYKVRRTGSIEKRIESVGIDVFPIDGLPNNRLIRELHYFRLQVLRMFYHLGFFEKINIARPGRSGYQLLIMKVYGKMRKFIGFDGAKWRDRMDRVLKKCPPEHSKYLMNFIGVYGKKEVFPRDVFYPTREMQFEGLMVHVPGKTNQYLRQLYGDWEKPPENKEAHFGEKLFEE